MSAPGAGWLLFEFVRHWSRRAAAGDGSVAERGRLILVIEAVSGLAGHGRPVTVNAVAGEIAIDQSGASRLVGNAVAAGYLTMTASPSDGRRREIDLTPHGHAVLQQAHSWQDRVFDELTSGWSDRRRNKFQAAMTDLILRSDQLNG